MQSLKLSTGHGMALAPLMIILCIPLMGQKPKKTSKKKSNSPIVLDEGMPVGKIKKPQVVYDLPQWILIAEKIGEVLQPFNPEGKKSVEEEIGYLKSRLKSCKGADDPDKLLQCADIQLALSRLTWMVGQDKYEMELEKFLKGEISVEPEQPLEDYGKAVELYSLMTEKAPQHARSDEAHYLLGACYSAMGKAEEAKKAWLAFACPGGLSKTKDDPYHGCKPLNKGSAVLPEIWFGVGEYHFDLDYTPSGVASAISAYRHAVEDKKSFFYGLILFKLAWSYYRYGSYPQAVENFIKVIELADSKTAAKSSHKTSYRPEAIQFMAMCLFEEDWDGDLVPDSSTAIERLKDPALLPRDKAWLPEVYMALGKLYEDSDGHMMAIEVFEELLKAWPLAPEAPEVLADIAMANRKRGNGEEELKTLDRLLSHGKGSTWWKAQEGKPETREKGLDIIKSALKGTGLFHHKEAQKIKLKTKGQSTSKMMEDCVAKADNEYNLAAAAYQKYIDTFPGGVEAYHLGFNMAEAYYWSGQFEKSVPAYEKTRDSKKYHKHRKDSAFMVVKALKAIQDKQMKQGKLVERVAPPGCDDAMCENGIKSVKVLPLPPVMQELTGAMMTYAELLPDDEKNAPLFLYAAGTLFYNYGHFDEAEDIAKKLIKDYCGSGSSDLSFCRGAKQLDEIIGQ
ncbi:MAG: tetratricopeptide repeat protein [Pseudomonadota bacterium]